MIYIEYFERYQFCSLKLLFPFDCTLLSAWPNLALNKPAYASSEWVAGDAQEAVDGNFDTNYYHNSCFHSGYGDTVGDAWWAVDLTDAYYVQYVIVTNRGDCCGKCCPMLLLLQLQL